MFARLIGLQFGERVRNDPMTLGRGHDHQILASLIQAQFGIGQQRLQHRQRRGRIGFGQRIDFDRGRGGRFGRLKLLQGLFDRLVLLLAGPNHQPLGIGVGYEFGFRIQGLEHRQDTGQAACGDRVSRQFEPLGVRDRGSSVPRGSRRSPHADAASPRWPTCSRSCVGMISTRGNSLLSAGHTASKRRRWSGVTS
jgi:hypothetical protein